MMNPIERRNVIPFLMGAGSVLVQIVLLREFVTVFSGNELDMGITLSVWLISVGIGSLAGTRLSGNKWLPLSFIAITILIQPSLFIVHMLRPVLGAEYGEVISLGSTIVSTFVIMFPLCLVLGMQFPLAVSWRGGQSASVYALEGAGAFTGGIVFTFLFSGRLHGDIILSFVSALHIFALFLVSRRWAAVLLLIVTGFFYFGLHRMVSEYALKGAELIERTESKYGEIAVLKTGTQKNVYAAGKLMYSYPDFEETEFLGHSAQLLGESSKEVLIVGGTPSLIKEILEYDPERITFVETDPDMISVSLSIMSDNDISSLRNRRVLLHAVDARMFIKKERAGKYDLIIMNIPEPSTANVNRFYTAEFFSEAARVLKKEGIIVLRLAPSHGYVGKRIRMLNGSIYYSLKDVFPFVGNSSEEYGLLFASGTPVDYTPDVLRKRFERMDITTDNFRPYVIDDAFDPLKTEMFGERIKGVNVLNSDNHPVAYLYNLMMWSEIHGGQWIVVLMENRGISIALTTIIILMIAVMLRIKNRIAYFSFFTTGYASMAFVIVIILSYQAEFGYVYERIGLITASFMLGIAFGGLCVKRIRNGAVWLQSGDAVLVILILSSLFVRKSEVYYYILVLGAGVVAGVQFAAASLSLGTGTSSGTAGRLYYADLGGSFMGAFLTSILFVPLLGIQNTVMFMVCIKAISFIGLFSTQWKK